MRARTISAGAAESGLAGPQAQRHPRDCCLRLQTCLRRFGQASEAKPLASDGLQSAESLRVVSERGGYSAPFENMNKIAAFSLLLDQLVAGLFGEGHEVPG